MSSASPLPFIGLADERGLSSCLPHSLWSWVSFSHSRGVSKSIHSHFLNPETNKKKPTINSLETLELSSSPRIRMSPWTRPLVATEVSSPSAPAQHLLQGSLPVLATSLPAGRAKLKISQSSRVLPQPPSHTNSPTHILPQWPTATQVFAISVRVQLGQSNLVLSHKGDNGWSCLQRG